SGHSRAYPLGLNDRKSRLSLLLMLALIGGTAWFLLSRQPLSSLGAALRQVRLWCVPGGLGLMTAYVGCEAMCSRLILGRLGHKVTYRQCLGYSFAGFYVSSITPSSTGG
ncbi:flippase-like domain-containing protein, partial [Intestinimonas massiliensis]|uniref:lysylphosphatidylglycerol synthase domain-containing protein n=1 Tax=Intestinimonas massiliensis (ex Afouda et al. 2020) TaxID=1673721 RepID=UPI00210C142A